jgi:hypothetical protein
MSLLFTALLSIASAITVAVLTHLLTQRRKRRDELAETRIKAYTDFINSASRLIAARRLGTTVDEPDDLAILNDAKARICICGHPQVVVALAHFWEQGGTLERESEVLAFTTLCLEMRKALVGASGDLPGTDISNTLFRVQPSTYSYKAAPKPPPSPEQLARRASRAEGDA